MKKRNPVSAILIALAALLVFTGCTDPVYVSSVKLDVQELQMVKGDEYTVDAVVDPDYVYYRELEWTVDSEGVVTVDNGHITAVGNGSAVVTATAVGGASASLNVVVEAPSISFTEEVVHLHKGDTHTLELVITPDYAAARPVVWSVDQEGIVSINDGVITGTDDGEVVVTATVEGVGSASVKVSVHTAVIELNVSNVSLVVGDKLQVNATVTPSVLPDRDVSWSVESGTAVTVDSTGLIEAVEAGDAVVVARHASGAYATLNVHVEDITVTLDTAALDMVVGDTYKMNAVVLPDFLVDRNVTWSVSGTGVSVDDTGLIKADGVGKATVTARHSSGAEASVAVNVEAVTVTVDHASLSLVVGDTFTVKATVGPDFISDKTVKWSVESGTSVTVNEDTGEISAVGVGSSVVAARHADGASATIDISVEAITVEVDKPELTMVIGDIETVTAVVGPDFLADRNVVWSVNVDNVVSVEDGRITAVGLGDAIVTATHARGKSASMNVSVKDADLIAGSKPIDEIITEKKLDSRTSLKIAGTLSDEDFKALNARSNLTSLDLSIADNTSIPLQAFMNNDTLTDITLPNGLTSIDGAAFAGTKKLKTVVIPESVTAIGASAFHSSSIESIVIPEGVVELGASAFDYCTSLTSVTLPSTLTSIGDRAFAVTPLSGAFSLPSGVESIGSNAFSGTRLSSVELPASLRSMYNTSFSSNLGAYRFLGDVAPEIKTDGNTTISPTAEVSVPSAALDTYRNDAAFTAVFKGSITGF